MDDDDNKKSHSNNEKATEAYRLFSEGKTPLEVAIELDLRAVLAGEIHTATLTLNVSY